MVKSKSLSFFLSEFLLLIFILSGCKGALEEEIDHVAQIDALMTKSVAVICVDVFAHWDDQLIYIGTACNTSGSTGGGGDPGGLASGYDPDDIVITNPYNAGGTPGASGGMSSVYNPSTGNQEYKFRIMSRIYGINSNLNLVQKAQVVYLLKAFLDTNSGKMLYNYLLTKNVKIHFLIDPSINYPALYDAKIMTIKIQDLNSLLINQLGEELLHAVQHQCFYYDLMDNKIKNYEFEVKVFFDLASIVDQLPIGYWPTQTDSNNPFYDSYHTWIDNMYYNSNGRFTDINGFNSLCDMWNGYSGTYIFNFQPKLLNYFFRKPIPPLP